LVPGAAHTHVTRFREARQQRVACAHTHNKHAAAAQNTSGMSASSSCPACLLLSKQPLDTPPPTGCIAKPRMPIPAVSFTRCQSWLQLRLT
jgi:hypothetical protein